MLNLSTVPGFGHALQERHTGTEGSLAKSKQSIQRPGRMSTHKDTMKELAFRTEKQSLKGRMVIDCEGVAQKTNGHGLFLISVRVRTQCKMGLNSRKEDISP